MQKTRNLLMIPGPTNVPNRIMAAMQRPMINHRGPEFRQLYRSLYEGMQYAFQTKNHVFALTCSGTGGVECAVSNTISLGDKVVIPVNGGFSQRFKEKIETFGGVPIEIPVEWGKAATPDQIREAVEREKNVKAIAVVYNETSTGVKMHGLDEVGRIAEKHNALLIVDAVSVLCGDDLPVDKWKVDLCVVSTQKCLACPPGLALVSVSEKAWQVIQAGKHTSYYFSLLKCKEFHEKEETPFTPSIPLYYALDEALKMLKEEGLENRIKRHKKCAGAFYNAFRKMGLQLFADENFLSNTVIAVKIPQGIADKDWRDILREKYGVVVAGGMGKTKGTIIRIGSMGIVSEAEVNITIDAIGRSLNDLGHKVDLKAGLEVAKNTFASPL
jgi:aspartate aminotransferase-like enzyme